MQYHRWLAPVFFLLLTLPAQSQSGSGMGGHMTTGSVHVHIVFADDRRAGTNLLVRLMQGSSSTPIATTYTNDAGQADFRSIAIGSYHVEVSGEGIRTTQSEVFDVDPRQVSQSQYVTVQATGAPGAQASVTRSQTISAAELNVPKKAKEQLLKALDSMKGQDWNKALERLNKAIAIYPQYAAAYNNLGVLYNRMNDEIREQQALEKAISLDDHLVPAFTNLGKLQLRLKDFPRAEAMLKKAVVLDPGNVESLMLLADAQYMNQHFEAAIASARHAHDEFSKHPSLVHYIAARAYQHENRPQHALAEFQIFLKEEPIGPRADHVRNDIAGMQGPG